MVRCAVRGDRYQAARGGGAADQRGGGEVHAGGGDVVAEDAAELVVGHAAQEGHPRAQRGRHRAGVGRRAAAALLAGGHVVVEPLGGGGVDQRHCPLAHGVTRQEGLVHRRHHVDDGVADAEDVEPGRAGGGDHAVVLLLRRPAYHCARVRATGRC
jgi:hypothetical protein